MEATTERDAEPAPAATAPAITLFALHFLGGSADQWDALIAGVVGGVRWVTLDLPGFGAAAADDGYGVAAMADRVAARVRAERPARWGLVGHSMGAKVAAVVARRAEDGEPGLEGLARIVLLAGSPPSPEPIEEDKRAAMLAWFAGNPERARVEAETYVSANVAAPLLPAVHARTVADVLRAQRAAWVAWLRSGSREDWATRIGTLDTPALIVAGASDAALGPDAQSRLMAPHFAKATLVVLDGAGHLLPMERPAELGRLVAAHLSKADGGSPAGAGEPALDTGFLTLLHGDRVSARTRAVLLARAQPVAFDGGLVSAAAFATLRALVDQIVPQAPGPRIDLAARIVKAVQADEGDGWRFADLPPDGEALAAGLAALDHLAQGAGGTGFAALDAPAQSALLHRLAEADGNEAATGAPLSPAQTRLWFEEMRAAVARAYVSHPATLARIGYGGFANGGDGPRKQGFTTLGPGRREDWEPATPGGAPR